MSLKAVLECKDVGRQFKIGSETVVVLENIDLCINQGEMASIVGASGSGKTTLLNLLAGLDNPSHGEVSMVGQPLRQLNDRKRAALRNGHMGFVFQFHHLLPEFSALENVLMPCRINGYITNEQRDRAKELLDNVGLGQRIQHRPSELSGGERQRVAIARALINRPDFILMDEPTGNLDEATSESVQRLITRLNDSFDTSFIVVTHNQEWARQHPVQFKLSKGKLDKIQ
ncbi:MAG: ABC transporter ATP-binding protein [Reinekea sp.]|jgi:lipoprotein-releasing system ATP-binding protein